MKPSKTKDRDGAGGCSSAAPGSARMELTRRGRIVAADADHRTITVRMDLPIAAGLTLGDEAWVTYTAENSLSPNVVW